MSEHNRKATISEDGKNIIFYHKGHEWKASPCGHGGHNDWFVAPKGRVGFVASSIWDALESIEIIYGKEVVDSPECLKAKQGDALEGGQVGRPIAPTKKGKKK